MGLCIKEYAMEYNFLLSQLGFPDSLIFKIGVLVTLLCLGDQKRQVFNKALEQYSSSSSSLNDKYIEQSQFLLSAERCGLYGSIHLIWH